LSCRLPFKFSSGRLDVFDSFYRNQLISRVPPLPQKSLKTVFWEECVIDDGMAAELSWPAAAYSRCAASFVSAREVEAELVDLPNSVDAVPLAKFLKPEFNEAFNNPEKDPNHGRTPGGQIEGTKEPRSLMPGSV
jgi:hypothetical protein